MASSTSAGTKPASRSIASLSRAWMSLLRSPGCRRARANRAIAASDALAAWRNGSSGALPSPVSPSRCRSAKATRSTASISSSGRATSAPSLPNASPLVRSSNCTSKRSVVRERCNEGTSTRRGPSSWASRSAAGVPIGSDGSSPAWRSARPRRGQPKTSTRFDAPKASSSAASSASAGATSCALPCSEAISTRSPGANSMRRAPSPGRQGCGCAGAPAMTSMAPSSHRRRRRMTAFCGRRRRLCSARHNHPVRRKRQYNSAAAPAIAVSAIG